MMVNAGMPVPPASPRGSQMDRRRRLNGQTLNESQMKANLADLHARLRTVSDASM